MNPKDHQDIPAGTLHEQDRNGPVTVLRDYDTLLVDRWRLSVEEAVRLRGIINDTLLDMTAAREEMREEAAGTEDDPEPGCRGCAPGGSDSEHEKDCPFGPEAYKSHRPGCDCWDCEAERCEEALEAAEIAADRRAYFDIDGDDRD